jgi:hypothetical protein
MMHGPLSAGCAAADNAFTNATPRKSCRTGRLLRQQKVPFVRNEAKLQVELIKA